MKTEWFLNRYQTRVDTVLQDWAREKFLARLWHKDPALWSAQPASELSDRLGWMDLPHAMIKHVEDLKAFAEQVRNDGIRKVLLLGMGGSSLAPEVFQKVMGHASGFPELWVLDSTHPAEIQRLERQLDLERTLFLVSSKSGTTLETLSLFYYFWDKLQKLTREPGRWFVAVTDPGSPLEVLAGQRGFRRIFPAPPDVGGRYSALSYFGLVPAALIGASLTQLLASALRAAGKNGAVCNISSAPGILLGAALGVVAQERNKLTVFASPGLSDFPPWLEQLLAESTGKDGKGLIPIVNEPILQAQRYSEDRCFVLFLCREEDDRRWSNIRRELTEAGHPVLVRVLNSTYDLTAEMYHWEFATAAASALLGVHPFDQPDVQLTKELTRAAMQELGEGQEAGEATAVSISVLSREKLQAWMDQATPGTYIALQAFLAHSPEIEAGLNSLRETLLVKTGRATTLGFGPRYLHSSGQLHKGGPSCGLFLQLIDRDYPDLPVPEHGYSFADLIRSQSQGDYQALLRGERPILRIDLEADAASGLKILNQMAAGTG
jgi:transaldolase/glucose-6-phosphate isomerase